MSKICAVEELKMMLQTGTEDERATVTAELGAMGNDAALAIVVSALPQEKSAYVRRKMISMLGAKNDAFVASLVMPLLSADEAHVRGMAREILVKLGSVAVEGLTGLMLHDSRDVRKQAVDVMAEIPGESTFELLVEGLSDADLVVVAGCADALGRRGDLRAAAALSKCLKTFPATWLGFALIQALNALGDEANIAVMNEYMSAVKTRGERMVLAGAWAEAVGRSCRLEALPLAWELFLDGILPEEELLRILIKIQSRQPELDLGHPALNGLLDKTLREGSGDSLMDAAGLAVRYIPLEFAAALPAVVEKIAQDERFVESDALGLLANMVLSAGFGSEDMRALLVGKREGGLILALLVAEAGKLPLPFDELLVAYRKAGPDNAARILRLAARSDGQALELYRGVLDEESNEEILAGALDGAALMPEDCAAAFFCQALLHRLAFVRKAAMDYLSQKKPPGVAEILTGQLTENLIYAWPEILAVLAAFHPAGLAERWQQAARIGDAEVRVRLAAAMGYISDEILFLSVIKTLVNDPESAVRRMVILSLIHRSGEQVWEMLRYLYENDPEKSHRCHILACQEVGRHPEGFEWLKSNLSEQDLLLQSAAVRGLGGLGVKGRQLLDEVVSSRPDDERLREMVENV